MKTIFCIGMILALLSGCSRALDKPAKPETLENFQKVREMYPQIEPDYAQAESDGVITKGELWEILEKVKKIKAEQNR